MARMNASQEAAAPVPPSSLNRLKHSWLCGLCP